MATTIHCDYTGCQEVADMLISNLTNGETMAWCGPHYVEGILATADALATSEADQAAAEAAARLAPETMPTPEQEAELDAAAVEARLAGDADADPTAPAHVIHRGQSARARAHAARLTTAQVIESPVEVEAAGGPEDDEPDDADEAVPVTQERFGDLGADA